MCNVSDERRTRRRSIGSRTAAEWSTGRAKIASEQLALSWRSPSVRGCAQWGGGTVHCEAGLAGGLQWRGPGLCGTRISGGACWWRRAWSRPGCRADAALVAISKRTSLRSSRVGVLFRLSCQILPRKAITNTMPAARTIQLDIDSVITLSLGSRKKKKAPTEVNNTTVALLERGETQKERQPASFVEPGASRAATLSARKTSLFGFSGRGRGER